MPLTATRPQPHKIGIYIRKITLHSGIEKNFLGLLVLEPSNYKLKFDLNRIIIKMAQTKF